MTEPLHILIADDDELLSQFIALHLHDSGHQTEIVGDGESAVTAALSYRFDVVLLDWKMPTLDGFAAAALLRQLGYTKPLILMSADIVESTLFDVCLQKPLQVPELLACLGSPPEQPLSLVIDPQLQQQFFNALSDIETSLQQAVAINDEVTIRKIVHQLKGSAESFGASAITDAADRLQICWQHQAIQSDQLVVLMQLLAQERERVA